MNPAGQLAAGILALGLNIPDAAQAKLLDYLALIKKWNRVYNLTALQDLGEMVDMHLLDSLAVVPHLTAASTLDVGSGAGLPGIPLALAWPQATVTLLDSNQKKTTFLKQAAIELKMTNVNVVCARAEEWPANQKFDIVISRAFSTLTEFSRVAGQLCSAEGTMAAMKGIYPTNEIEQLPATSHPARVIPLQVPGVHAERHLVLFKPE